MAHTITEQETYFQTSLPRILIYELKKLALSRGVSLKRLVREALIGYLKSLGLNHEENPGPNP